MIEAIASFFGIIIRFIYECVNNNYFVSILIFTFLTKLILLPLTLMQLKTTEKMQELLPKEQAIRDKYKNDKQKQAEELSKLYSENKVNTMGGCLPLLIQLPIILAMFYIVKQPLTYVLEIPAEQIKEYVATYLEKSVEEVTDTEMRGYEIQVAKQNDLLDMEVAFGINLGDTPSYAFSDDEAKKSRKISLLIPILTVLLSYLQTKIMQKNSNMTEEQQQIQKSNSLMLPLMSGILAYSMPLALGVYWLFGNILNIIQQLIVSRFTKKKKELLKLDKGGVVNEKS